MFRTQQSTGRKATTPDAAAMQRARRAPSQGKGKAEGCKTAAAQPLATCSWPLQPKCSGGKAEEGRRLLGGTFAHFYYRGKGFSAAPALHRAQTLPPAVRSASKAPRTPGSFSSALVSRRRGKQKCCCSGLAARLKIVHRQQEKTNPEVFPLRHEAKTSAVSSCLLTLRPQ